MKHIYQYTLLFVLILLSSCTKKPMPGMMEMPMPAEMTSGEEAPEESEGTPATSQPATWMNSTSESGIYRTGNPYKVNGVWFFPQKEIDPNHDEIGEAGWYGHDFHNKMTANGEIFDMNGFTAAHKTLPLPSVVRVTNLSNKKSVILRVNDRGPFDTKRIIDVSKKAAELLGFLDQGTAKVRVQILPEESKHVAAKAKGTSFNPQKTLSTQAGQVTMSPMAPMMAPQPPAITTPTPLNVAQPVSLTAPTQSNTTLETEEDETALAPPNAEVLESILPQGDDMLVGATTAAEAAIQNISTPTSTPTVNPTAPLVDNTPSKTGTIFIQAGAYRNKANAENAIKKLNKIASAHLSEPTGQSSLYRVRIGPFSDKQIAKQALKQVVSAGHPDATIIG